ncbi:aconitate hydratase AcnA [Hoeflea alexandrii]|uniref:aconitate hydratase AcnA n=1 Tax=Hoeflea alexandrii TaxID=288436 RepID=UPI0022AE54F5|nr:aconitate hydratase AcnA [Hoeflea alexandrii]MCZ4291604.1 aconitate hydratase AcnA [Hoeflea alexandrii]
MPAPRHLANKSISPAAKVAQLAGLDPHQMPRTAYLLAENVAAFCPDPEQPLRTLGAWLRGGEDPGEIPFQPTRILMQDTAGVAALADLAGLRSLLDRRGLSPERVDSALPIDLVIDHSVHVEHSGTSDAMIRNMESEMDRNVERYGFFKWAEGAFANLRVVPPGQGICHQINLEQLARIAVPVSGHKTWHVCGSVVGTDSHTTMINALGVLGWGVGGMEAEVAALGQPLGLAAQRMTRVVLTGKRQSGVTAADLALAITKMLREEGVVSEFIEFGGPFLDALSLPDRAAIANMAPEYGAICGLFPVDHVTLAYLAQMGRSTQELKLYTSYAQESGLWRDDTERRLWQREIEIDLSSIGLSMAGPSRPDQTHPLSGIPDVLAATGRGPFPVAVAAITSCTNTANPESMIAAGLVARAARSLGVRIPDHVKTSLAPGSRRIAALLVASGLQNDLDALGFQIVGFGCTTCVGNSGELLTAAEDLRASGAELCAVLSGNRNFEGRIHPLIKSNWLASPPLVVIAALAGSLAADMSQGAIAKGSGGQDVCLADLWPTDELIAETLRKAEMALGDYSAPEAGTSWDALAAPSGALYPWKADSLFIQPPPFFDDHRNLLEDLHDARVLVALGEAVTTDHISPVGRIAPNSPAARLVQSATGSGSLGSYGAYRANHEVMMRGTFAHPQLFNRLAPDRGPKTAVTGLGIVDIFEASTHYRGKGIATVVLAGGRYGMGSARDWAAKGTQMLGVRAVLATGFERIHRTNLIGTGVVPIEVPSCLSVEAALLPDTRITVIGLASMDKLQCRVRVVLQTPGEPKVEVEGVCRIDTATELAWIRAGGVFALVRDKICAAY